MKLLITCLACLFLVYTAYGWLLDLGLDGYRDAQSNYHEMMTQCEQEGGECINVNIFRGTVGRSGGAEDRGAPSGRQGLGRPGPARRQDPQAIFNYLYNECRSWEFDPGCYRKGNVCCY